MALDPVCGREINPKQSSWLLSYRGGIYHFCSGSCRHRFDNDPEGFTRIEFSQISSAASINTRLDPQIAKTSLLQAVR